MQNDRTQLQRARVTSTDSSKHRRYGEQRGSRVKRGLSSGARGCLAAAFWCLIVQPLAHRWLPQMSPGSGGLFAV